MDPRAGPGGGWFRRSCNHNPCPNFSDLMPKLKFGVVRPARNLLSASPQPKRFRMIRKCDSFHPQGQLRKGRLTPCPDDGPFDCQILLPRCLWGFAWIAGWSLLAYWARLVFWRPTLPLSAPQPSRTRADACSLPWASICRDVTKRDYKYLTNNYIDG